MPSSGKVEGELISQVSLQSSHPPPPSERSKCGCSDNIHPQGRGRGRETLIQKGTKKAPVLVQDGQLHHCHNHQHPKGLWKRQILPRPALATLQLQRPSAGPWGAGAGELELELGLGWGWGGGVRGRREGELRFAQRQVAILWLSLRAEATLSPPPAPHLLADGGFMIKWGDLLRK